MARIKTKDLTRRDVLAGGVAVGAMLAAGPLSSSGAMAAPKKGGKLRAGLGHGSTTDSLDPATYENGFMGAFKSSVYHNLAVTDDKGQIKPELAESWSASDDASVWNVKLRQGVEFHDGKTMDADDVVASINHHRGEKSKSAAKPLLKAMKDIKADGKNNVVITLESGNADLPWILSDYHLAIGASDGEGKINWEKPNGTGGYKLEKIEPGVRASFKRFANFYQPDSAYFDEVEIISIIDVTARTNALTSGDIDVMDRCDLKTVHLLKRNKNVVIDEVTGTKHYTFAMDTRKDPYSNNHVRMALKLGINREEILQKVLRGHGALGNDHPISPANPYFHKELAQRPYDPEKAKWHVKQAGLDKLQVELSAADAAYPGAVDAAVLYSAAAEKAGIELKVIREPNDGYWSNVWMKKPWSAVYWNGRPTEDWMLSTAYAGGAPWNDTFWKHDKFDKVLVEARAELDSAKRREMYAELQTILHNEGGVVIPMFANYVWARGKNLMHGENLSPTWDLDGGKYMERWWFA